MSAPTRTHGESKFDRPPAPGQVWALCWCADDYVAVTLDDLARCRTRECGRLGCAEPDDWSDWCP